MALSTDSALCPACACSTIHLRSSGVTCCWVPVVVMVPSCASNTSRSGARRRIESTGPS